MYSDILWNIISKKKKHYLYLIEYMIKKICEDPSNENLYDVKINESFIN